MWSYRQTSGCVQDSTGLIIGNGYAGRGPGRNNPVHQDEHNIGPLPQGLYKIQPPQDTETHGPFVMWLTPAENNRMFGRSSFGIHGDSVEHPGLASNGCICLPRSVRETIWASGDHVLLVIA